jgi:hypothetical protein
MLESFADGGLPPIDKLWHLVRWSLTESVKNDDPRLYFVGRTLEHLSAEVQERHALPNDVESRLADHLTATVPEIFNLPSDEALRAAMRLDVTIRDLLKEKS